MSGGAFATKAGGPDLPNFSFSRPSGTEPTAEYARLRKECPVAQAPLFDGSPIWLITKHRDCVSVLSDPRFSKIRTHPGFPELAPGAKAAIEGREPTFVDMDPPNHMRFRSIFEPWLVWPHVETLRPRREQTEGRGRAVQGPKPANLPEAFSLPVAFKTIYEMLEELQSYMENLVEQKLKSPTDDILSKAGQGAGQRAGQRAGRGATGGATDGAGQGAGGARGNGRGVAETQLKTGRITRDQLGVVTLLDHPDQAYALRRVALEDVKARVVGVGWPGVIGIGPPVQSANRDEEVFPNPNRFDIFRSPNAQLAYGSGTHLCVAMPLANVELECALGGLVRRLPNLKLAVPTSELQYSEPSQDVGLKELPVTW
eukprot:scaffold4.g4881.t1